MSNRRLLGSVIGLTLVILFVVGCGAGTPEPPTAAPTPAPPTATPTPVPPTATPIPATGTVKGMVTRNGKPLANAIVGLQTSDESIVLNTKTDSQGNYIFKDVKPGEYLMFAGTEDGCGVIGGAKVEAGKESVVDFKLNC